jgi:F0F1-type ATP synthase delta subunit
MNITRAKLAEVIAEKTMHVSDTSVLATEIAAYALTENMTGDISSLLRDVMQHRADKGYVEATAVSAHPLSREGLSDIKKVLKAEYPAAKSIIVNEQIDPAVIGGIRITLANERLDLTIQSKLNAFRRLTQQERNIA